MFKVGFGYCILICLGWVWNVRWLSKGRICWRNRRGLKENWKTGYRRRNRREKRRKKRFIKILNRYTVAFVFHLFLVNLTTIA